MIECWAIVLPTGEVEYYRNPANATYAEEVHGIKAVRLAQVRYWPLVAVFGIGVVVGLLL